MTENQGDIVLVMRGHAETIAAAAHAMAGVRLVDGRSVVCQKSWTCYFSSRSEAGRLDRAGAAVEADESRFSSGRLPAVKRRAVTRPITLEVFAPHKEYLLLSRDLLPKWWAER